MFLIGIRLKKCVKKTILKNAGTLKSVSDCYKNQEMCNKAVGNYPHAVEYVPECFMTQKTCDKVVNTYSFTIQFVPECYKTQKICDKAFSKSFLAFYVFFIDMKLEKCVRELFLMILIE